MKWRTCPDHKDRARWPWLRLIECPFCALRNVEVKP